MNIELKPIAESKVRQLGGDVCGVLVRNEAGAWAAVSEGGRVMWLDDFEPVPVARNEDVALPSHATKSDLIDCIDLMADEFKRIKALNPGDEILDLCDRALRVTEQNVPVLEVRDRLQKTVSKLLWKVSDLEDQLEAARAQSGQGVEPVAWVAPTATGIFYGETAEEAAANAESFGATLAGTIPLYTHPQPAQQGSVPESIATDDDVERVAKMAGWNNRRYMTPPDYAEWCRRMREFVRLSTTPQPEGDGWIKCSERLPKLGQRVQLFSQGVIQHMMPLFDDSDEGLFWDFEVHDYNPPVDMSRDQWRPLPQPPQEGSSDEH